MAKKKTKGKKKRHFKSKEAKRKWESWKHIHIPACRKKSKKKKRRGG